MRLLFLNGVNLNMTGIREPNVYGNETLDSINAELKTYCLSHNVEATFLQSNIEGELVNILHSAQTDFDGVILNAGAYTHYSYAIRDAIASIKTPVIEVHMSNIMARDDFRSKSVLSEVCRGCISGFGKDSYRLAADFFINSQKEGASVDKQN